MFLDVKTNTAQDRHEPQLIKYEEAARRYSVSERYLRQLVRAGILPKVRLGQKLVRLPLPEADLAMREYMTGGKAVR